MLPFDPKNLKNEAPRDLDEETVDRIVEMAWEDRTPFEAIQIQFGLTEKQVIDGTRFEGSAHFP